MAIPGRILVYGGKGALGAACVSRFKSNNWWVGSIDMKSNDDADANIIVDGDNQWIEQEKNILQQVGDALKEDKVDGVICVAGGWAGGNVANASFVKNCDLMWKQSVWSSVLAAKIACKYLKDDGFICLTGAQAALEATPSMIGYGLAKAAVHQLTKSLSSVGSGLPEYALATAILPVTLDTPMNRKWMSGADYSKWTPLEFITETFWKWAQNQERPTHGSLLEVITEDNETKLLEA